MYALKQINDFYIDKSHLEKVLLIQASWSVRLLLRSDDF